MATTTPSEITPAILEFVEGFRAQAPAYVAVADTMTPLECFDNSAQTVAKTGGRVVLGWAIWERSGAFIEAEHHAVVERPDGTLVDVTPHDGNETRILFARDPSATYDGKSERNSHRRAITDDPDVVEYVALSDRFVPLIRQMQRSGEDALPTSERNRLVAKMPRFAQLLSIIDLKYPGNPT